MRDIPITEVCGRDCTEGPWYSILRTRMSLLQSVYVNSAQFNFSTRAPELYRLEVLALRGPLALKGPDFIRVSVYLDRSTGRVGRSGYHSKGLQGPA